MSWNLRQKLVLLLYYVFCHTGQISAAQLTIIPLSNRPAVEIQALIAPFLAPNDRVIADGSNLIIKTSPQRLDEIKQLIAQLDTRLNNLLITVIQGRNISASQLNASAQAAVHIPLDNPKASQGLFKGRFQQSQSHGHENYTQKLRTLEGHTAYIKTGSSQAMQNRQIYKPGYYNPVQSGSTELIEASTGFAVTPRLSGNQVIIEVSPWSEQFKRNGHIETRSAKTTLRAKLGEWVEIGGSDETRTYGNQRLLSTARGSRADNTRILLKVDQE